MNAPVEPRGKAALAFIFVTVLIDMLTLGMIIPVLPILVQDSLAATRRAPRPCMGCSALPRR